MPKTKKFIYIDNKALKSDFAKEKNLRMTGIYQLTYVNGKLSRHELISASPTQKVIDMCKKETETFFRKESFKGVKPKRKVTKKVEPEIEEVETDEEVLTEVPVPEGEETSEQVLTEVPETENEEVLEESSENLE